MTSRCNPVTQFHVVSEHRSVDKLDRLEPKDNESLASTEALGAEAVSSLHAESSDLAANIDAHTRRSAGLEKDVARSSFSSVRRVGSGFRKVAMSSSTVSDDEGSTLSSVLSETRTRLLSTAGLLTWSA